jgi:cytochrome c oxidase subunit I
MWTLHYLATGLHPFLTMLILPILLFIGFHIYRLLKKLCKPFVNFRPDVLFFIGLLSYLILICSLQIFYEKSPLKIPLHDAYFKISYPYPLIIVAIAFGFFTVIYYWLYTTWRKKMNQTFGYIHFWVSFLGTTYIILPVLIAGLGDMPRRYYDYGHDSNFQISGNQNTTMSVVSLILVFMQLLFLCNVCYVMIRKPK